MANLSTFGDYIFDSIIKFKLFISWSFGWVSQGFSGNSCEAWVRRWRIGCTVRGDKPRLMGVATVAIDPFQMIYRGHYITNPNNALLRGNHAMVNPSNWPYIYIVLLFDAPQIGSHFMIPGITILGFIGKSWEIPQIDPHSVNVVFQPTAGYHQWLAWSVLDIKSLWIRAVLTYQYWIPVLNLQFYDYLSGLKTPRKA